MSRQSFSECVGLTKSPLPERDIANGSKVNGSKSVTLCVCVCVCMYIHIHVCHIFMCIYVYIYFCPVLCSVMSDSETVTCKASLSMGFPRQVYWRKLPFPTPGDLPNPGIKSTSLVSPAWTSRFLHRKNKALTQEK